MPVAPLLCWVRDDSHFPVLRFFRVSVSRSLGLASPHTPRRGPYFVRTGPRQPLSRPRDMTQKTDGVRWSFVSYITLT